MGMKTLSDRRLPYCDPAASFSLYLEFQWTAMLPTWRRSKPPAEQGFRRVTSRLSEWCLSAGTTLKQTRVGLVAMVA